MSNKLLSADTKEAQILELDADKIFLVSDTFKKIEMYLQADAKRGYIKLNAPGLYNFQLPHQDSAHDGTTKNEVNETIITDSWIKEQDFEVNLINTQDDKQLGMIQRDPDTGDMYMLVPLEVNVLLQHGTQDLGQKFSSVVNEEPNIATIDSSITLAKSEVDNTSQTTLTDKMRENESLENENACQLVSGREICNFELPKMSLKFKLTMELDEIDRK